MASNPAAIRSSSQSHGPDAEVGEEIAALRPRGAGAGLGVLERAGRRPRAGLGECAVTGVGATGVEGLDRAGVWPKPRTACTTTNTAEPTDAGSLADVLAQVE